MRTTLPIALLALTACAGPDLGEAPFFCNNGTPLCPEGYVCNARNVCVREGTTAPVPAWDARADRPRAADAAVVADAAVALDQAQTGKEAKPALPDAPPPPVPGSVSISELMANPSAATDTDGEWIELHNSGSKAVDVNGWTLKDLGSDLHQIAAPGALLIPAGGYLVLGRSTDKAKNGGANVAYAYSGFVLANTSDEIVLLDKAGKTVDSVAYSSASGFVIPDGASLSLKKAAGDKNQGASWCEETSAWPGSAGDKGTPGAAPGC